MKQRDDFLIQKQVFLGGRISKDHEAFKEIARLTPDFWLVKHILEQEGMDKETLQLIDDLGMCEFVRYSDEITRLSMIVGDDTETVSVKKEMEDARQTRSNP